MVFCTLGKRVWTTLLGLSNGSVSWLVRKSFAYMACYQSLVGSQVSNRQHPQHPRAVAFPWTVYECLTCAQVQPGVYRSHHVMHLLPGHMFALPSERCIKWPSLYGQTKRTVSLRALAYLLVCLFVCLVFLARVTGQQACQSILYI